MTNDHEDKNWVQCNCEKKKVINEIHGKTISQKEIGIQEDASVLQGSSFGRQVWNFNYKKDWHIFVLVGPEANFLKKGPWLFYSSTEYGGPHLSSLAVFREFETAMGESLSTLTFLTF